MSAEPLKATFSGTGKLSFTPDQAKREVRADGTVILNFSHLIGKKPTIQAVANGEADADDDDGQPTAKALERYADIVARAAGGEDIDSRLIEAVLGFAGKTFEDFDADVSAALDAELQR